MQIYAQFQRLEYLHQSDDLQIHAQTLASKDAVRKINKPTLQNINIIELKTLQTMFNGFKYMLRYKIRNLKDQFCEQVYISYLSTQSMLIDVTSIVATICNWSKSSSYGIKYL